LHHPRALQPDERNQVHGLRHREVPFSNSHDPRRSRSRIPGSIPLARLYQAAFAGVEWKGGTFASKRSRGVLSTSRYTDDVDLEMKLRELERYYNYDRPHGGLNEQSPYEALRCLLQKSENRP